MTQERGLTPAEVLQRVIGKRSVKRSAGVHSAGNGKSAGAGTRQALGQALSCFLLPSPGKYTPPGLGGQPPQVDPEGR